MTGDFAVVLAYFTHKWINEFMLLLDSDTVFNNYPANKIF